MQRRFRSRVQILRCRSSSPGAVASIPNVKWKDVGGLGQAKDEVMDMITLPLKHPELFASEFDSALESCSTAPPVPARPC